MPLFTTILEVDGIGKVTVTTEDFSKPGYEVCGFESVTSFEDGDSWGIGPDNGESPHELHNIAVEHVCNFMAGPKK